MGKIEYKIHKKVEESLKSFLKIFNIKDNIKCTFLFVAPEYYVKEYALSNDYLIANSILSEPTEAYKWEAVFKIASFDSLMPFVTSK